MLEFVEVTAMPHCALCGALIVDRDSAVEGVFCSARCARTSRWYVPERAGDRHETSSDTRRV